jgi:hypothetical protein
MTPPGWQVELAPVQVAPTPGQAGGSGTRVRPGAQPSLEEVRTKRTFCTHAHEGPPQPLDRLHALLVDLGFDSDLGDPAPIELN